MKKILALVLAVAMMSTMAFAATVNLAGLTNANPGDVLTIDFTSNMGSAPTWNLTADNFAISVKKITKGANLIKSIAINEGKGVKITLVSDYTMIRPEATKAPNLIIEEIAIKAKRDIKVNGTTVIARNATFTYEPANGQAMYIGYVPTKVALDTTTTVDYVNGGITQFNGDQFGLAKTAVLDDMIVIEGRAYNGDKIYTNLTATADSAFKAIIKKYEDADLQYVKFDTTGLSSNHNVYLFADENAFVYELVDGALVESNLKWSADDWAWIGKTRTAKAYVISDVKLAVKAAEEAVKNPSTGAADVAGVAAALAVVSLVAAGAVSMKK